jgi:quercetin dioxygenase-like cupin family protein
MRKPSIVKVSEGEVKQFESLEGAVNIRVVHPTAKAASKNLSVQMLYVAPGGRVKPGAHPNEEVYVVLSGEGRGLLAGKPVALEKGLFIHLPPGSVHGVENTGDEMLIILIATAPPNP